MKKINKKQVAEILGVHTKSLSRWDNEKIKYQLAKACYKVIDIAKEGRSIYFYIEYKEYSQSNDEFLEDVFKVKDIKDLKKYTRRKIERNNGGSGGSSSGTHVSSSGTSHGSGSGRHF